MPPAARWRKAASTNCRRRGRASPCPNAKRRCGYCPTARTFCWNSGRQRGSGADCSACPSRGTVAMLAGKTPRRWLRVAAAACFRSTPCRTYAIRLRISVCSCTCRCAASRRCHRQASCRNSCVGAPGRPWQAPRFPLRCGKFWRRRLPGSALVVRRQFCVGRSTGTEFSLARLSRSRLLVRCMRMAALAACGSCR